MKTAQVEAKKEVAELNETEKKLLEQIQAQEKQPQDKAQPSLARFFANTVCGFGY